MKEINLKALKYLNAIERFGSLRKASHRLNVDPSAVSRVLTQLEDSIGLSVWHRNNQKAVITDAGEELLAFFRKVQASETATLSRLHDLRGLRSGVVRIAVGEGFIADLISEPLQSFLTRYPGIKLEIEMAGASDAIQLCESDEVDFALVYGAPHSPKLRCHIETRHPLVLIVPTAHPLAESTREMISLSAISDLPLALIDGSTGMGRLVRLAEETTHLHFEPILQTNSVTVLKNFVTSGIGGTFMPIMTVYDDWAAGRLAIRHVDNLIFQQGTAKIISHENRELTLAAQALLQHLHKNMQFLQNDAPSLNV